MPAFAGKALSAGCLNLPNKAASPSSQLRNASHASSYAGIRKIKSENRSRRISRKPLSDLSVSCVHVSSSRSVPAAVDGGSSRQNRRRPRDCLAAAAAVGSNESNSDRTDTVHSSRRLDEDPVATAAPEASDRPADVAVDAHEAEADMAAASEPDGRAGTAAAAAEAAAVAAIASESRSVPERAAAAPESAPASTPASTPAPAAAPASAAVVAVPVLLSLLALSLVLCNADRVIMSVAILPLSASNGWPPSVAGIVQSSFLWGYLITPIIGGSLADRYGGHPVLAAGLALWSLATLLTPTAAAHSLFALVSVRAVMGLGEGVALPCMNHMVSRHVPDHRRAWATGICFAGFHLGSMLGLLSAPSLMSLPALGVTGPFLIFGALGLLWLALWLLLVPGGSSAARASSAPSDRQPGGEGQGAKDKALKQQEVKQHGGMTPAMRTGSRVTVRQLLSHPASWAIIIANTVNNWGYFILLSWMPLYFNQVLHTDIRQAAWFSAGPWAVMAGMGLGAAALADWMEGKRGMSRTAVRKVMQATGFLGPAASLLLLARMPSAPLAALCLTAALGLSAFSQAGFLLNHKDIAPRHVGLLHGLSNTAGTLAGIASTVATGFMVERLGSFHAVLAITAALYVLASAYWLVFATADVVFP
ncbi:hypothetical protein CLOM_g2931 [Closterium sp. NIES-68]|nr:hypothetical protein CLOM_g2931 [Closterium sp. NIES-68]GJP73411.1 hypothetical protein CLOP_g4128 [Closterium sp. NIES-67]